MGDFVRDQEEAAIAFHEDSVDDAAAIWRDGLNMYLRGLDQFDRHKTKRKEESVQLALLIGAWTSLYWAFQTALRGYYRQALNLLRTPVEFWMAYWYLRSFPGEHERFLTTSSNAPTFNDMLQKVEARQGLPPDATVRGWIKRLHKFSHVDSANITLVFTPRKSGLQYDLGPQKDAQVFRSCTSEAAIAISMLLESLDNMRRLVGYDPLGDLKEFVDRVQAWQKTR